MGESRGVSGLSTHGQGHFSPTSMTHKSNNFLCYGDSNQIFGDNGNDTSRSATLRYTIIVPVQLQQHILCEERCLHGRDSPGTLRPAHTSPQLRASGRIQRELYCVLLSPKFWYTHVRRSQHCSNTPIQCTDYRSSSPIGTLGGRRAPRGAGECGLLFSYRFSNRQMSKLRHLTNLM